MFVEPGEDQVDHKPVQQRRAAWSCCPCFGKLITELIFHHDKKLDHAVERLADKLIGLLQRSSTSGQCVEENEAPLTFSGPVGRHNQVERTARLAMEGPCWGEHGELKVWYSLNNCRKTEDS